MIRLARPILVIAAAIALAATAAPSIGGLLDSNNLPSAQAVGGGNGVIRHAGLDHAVPSDNDGMSYNFVTNAFDDSGPASGDWDVNLYGSLLSFYKMPDNEATYVVNADDRVVVLQPGDVVGPDSLFSSSGERAIGPVLAWRSGTDGYVGVRFKCDGRLTNPVPTSLCYGYIHMTTAGPNGVPATILDTAFDGDGQPITIGNGGTLNDPSATVTPTSLSFTVAADATATQTLSIANAAGSSPLTYAIEARGPAQAPRLIPHVMTSKLPSKALDRVSEDKLLAAQAQAQAQADRPAATLLGSNPHASRRADLPWAPAGSIAFQLDDGSHENLLGFGGDTPSTESAAVFVNRFTATGALTIDSISILWPAQRSGAALIGRQANLVVYYDASGSGDLKIATRLGTDTLVTIASEDQFETYGTQFSVPGAGDVYIGFVNQWAMAGGFTPRLLPTAIDQNSTRQRASYISGATRTTTDINNLANNDFTGIIDVLAPSSGGNWLIRATGTDGGQGGPCTGAVVSWLTAAPANGSVADGTNVEVTVKVDPAAGSLDAGTYTGELCITTNDPTRALISVPVSLTVTAGTPPACGGADGIFCNGFDGEAVPPGDIYDSGAINLEVPNTFDGIYINWADGSHCTDGSCGGNLNIYALITQGGDGTIHFYWPRSGEAGVGISGSVYAVLGSGDTVGPDSLFTSLGGDANTSNWAVGVDAYLGFKFKCTEAAPAVCYGYANLKTTATLGFPATVVSYAYDRSGAAITIP